MLDNQSLAAGRPRVLMIRPSALGDVARTVPALVTLRKAMPHAHIDWLVQDILTEVIIHHPALDGVIPFARKQFGQMLKSPRVFCQVIQWAKQLRNQHYDLVIDLQGLLRSGLFARITGAPKRIGFANAREMAWLAYTHKHYLDTTMHTVDRMLNLLSMEGYPICHDMQLYLGDKDKQWLTQWLNDHGGSDQPYVCLAPTAQWRCKCWPADRVIEIGKRLLKHAPHLAGRLFVLAAPHQMQEVKPICQALNAPCPTTTVGQMMALISQTRLLLCNDSGPLHVAVGFDRPIVTTMGPTLASEVGPYQRPDTLVCVPKVTRQTAQTFRHHKEDQSLIAQITVDAVWEKVLEQWDRQK